MRGGLRIGDPQMRMRRAVLPPARLFKTHLEAAALAAGLGTRAGGAPPPVVLLPAGSRCDGVGAKPLSSVFSAPLLELLNHTLQVSDNTYAEALLRELGSNGTVGTALAACHVALSKAGVLLAGVQHVDGSGLSRHNLIPPVTFVSLLRTMARSPLRNVLPVGGRSGTLKHRFIGTAAEGRVFAKTGTEDGVSGLSGYLIHPQDDVVGEVTFSLLGNNGLGYGGLLRPVEDAIVTEVTNARA